VFWRKSLVSAEGSSLLEWFFVAAKKVFQLPLLLLNLTHFHKIEVPGIMDFIRTQWWLLRMREAANTFPYAKINIRQYAEPFPKLILSSIPIMLLRTPIGDKPEVSTPLRRYYAHLGLTQ